MVWVVLQVHLVSEHIWCDDYLVRSFYLKNLQTNETRTVTQFHFLTWTHLSVPPSMKALLDFRRFVPPSPPNPPSPQHTAKLLVISAARGRWLSLVAVVTYIYYSAQTARKLVLSNREWWLHIFNILHGN